MLLLIDNYDSFTYNLFQYLSELGEEVVVVRNDKTTIEKIEEMKPERIVVSPGPSTPQRAGISNDVVRHFGPILPILGVCLGHQCIGYSYGGIVGQAKDIMHGKSSQIMGLRHREHPVEGVQFHPESFMTHAGKDVLRNFLMKTR
jgi:anthranilate synthase component 2